MNRSPQLDSISVAELKSLLEAEDPTVLDVRTPPEYVAYHIPGAHLLPIQELGHRYSELEGLSPPLYVTCEHGVRSLHACMFLKQKGFEVVNIREGMHRWQGPIEEGL